MLERPEALRAIAWHGGLPHGIMGKMPTPPQKPRRRNVEVTLAIASVAEALPPPALSSCNFPARLI
ncbi:hypothetical protein HQ563_02475 [bacterium]|nr:hypothetical protein [bacterium]